LRGNDAPKRLACPDIDAAQPSGHAAMTIPNVITVLRICLVPILIWCIGSDAWHAAFWIFVAAGVSDGVDGFIAKRFDQKSELGAMLDPLADKVLLVSIYVSLGIVGVLPRWLVILVVFRDLMIVGAVLLSWVMGRPVRIAPLMLSKVNTGAQIVLAAFVLFTKGFGVEMAGSVLIASIAVAALTVASTAAYVRQWLGHMTS
jgi:cardiolipin synthase (CMP-forming)